MPSPTPPAGGGRNLSMILSAVAVILSAVALVVGFAIPGPAGAAGATGATGATGTTGANGARGPQGPAGTNFTIATTLKSGQNESGYFSAWGGGIGSYMAAEVNFRIPLAQALPDTNATFIANGAAYTTACPGPGQAAVGQLCVYEVYDGGRTLGNIFNPSTGGTGVGAYGFSIYFTVTAASAWSYGTWTVTAP